MRRFVKSRNGQALRLGSTMLTTSRSGQALVEIFIVITVGVFLFSAIAMSTGLVSRSDKSIAYTQDQSILMNSLANSLISSVKNNWNSLSDNTQYSLDANNMPISAKEIINANKVNRYFKITTIDPGTNMIKKVTVVVEPQDSREAKTLEMSFYLTNYQVTP
mgnify:CR=1 FL=1